MSITAAKSQARAFNVDMNYLLSLGPQALPALDRAIRFARLIQRLFPAAIALVEQQCDDMASWRAWSFRGWRLQRMLDARQQGSSAG